MASHTMKLANRKRRTSSLAFADKACHTCSKLNLTCDKARPQCAMCLQRGTSCPGYVQELKWGNGIASRGYNRFRKVPLDAHDDRNDAIHEEEQSMVVFKTQRLEKMIFEAVFEDTIQQLPTEARRFIYHCKFICKKSKSKTNIKIITWVLSLYSVLRV